jgi:hypothetical protein
VGSFLLRMNRYWENRHIRPRLIHQKVSEAKAEQAQTQKLDLTAELLSETLVGYRAHRAACFALAVELLERYKKLHSDACVKGFCVWSEYHVKFEEVSFECAN